METAVILTDATFPSSICAIVLNAQIYIAFYCSFISFKNGPKRFKRMYRYVTGKVIVRTYPPSSVGGTQGRSQVLLPLFLSTPGGGRFFLLAVIFHYG